MTMSIQPVILAGGTGSRLWPLSRSLYPKQVLNLISDQSLLQNTLERVSTLPDLLPPIIVVGEEHRFLVKRQIEETGLFSQYHILLEPIGRNTAPAIGGAAIFARENFGEDTILLILPADHLIRKVGSFTKTVQEAAKLAADGQLTTFGIVPEAPETGYGYIEKGEGNSVRTFVEKPDLPTAQKYLEAGNFFWNSGMFTFSVAALLNEMSQHTPEMLEQMELAVQNGQPDGTFFRFNKEAMASCPSDSIDYAVMEKTGSAAMVEADIGWSDIGSWKTLWEVSDKDEQGNVLSGDVIVEGVSNSLIRSEDTLVAAVGLDAMMVVETADAVLVAPVDRSQEVKKIVGRLKKEGRGEFQVHRTVYRPWGSYTTLELHGRFQIKRITVNPGAKLSSQMHHHRHEHWVVVEGTAKVNNGEEELYLHEDQSTYIPAGTIHRLENPGVIPLELIEVQIGSYLGEDDIVRFDDEYGR
jgi:mannose-1-phosphate guanylyltransferase/mannose-6-phosphate isomerase